MDLVVFGAGASFGAAGEQQPPLVRTLLADLRAFAPGSWGALSAEQEELFVRDFEAGMASVLEEASGFSEDEQSFKWTFPLSGPAKQWSDLQWDMAAFFFRFEPVHGNLYESFLKRCNAAGGLERINFTTLNYDRLLLTVANALSIRCHVGREGLTSNLRLCLPHGASFLTSSAQLRNTSEGGAFHNAGPGSIELVGGGPLLQLNAQSFTILRTPQAFAERQAAGDLYPPIMSYIEPDKFTASGGSVLARQRRLFSEWVADAQRIAVIGIKVHTPDRHLWEPLAKSPARILYVSPSAQDFVAWAATAGRSSDPDPISATWTDAFEPVCAFLDV